MPQVPAQKQGTHTTTTDRFKRAFLAFALLGHRQVRGCREDGAARTSREGEPGSARLARRESDADGKDRRPARGPALTHAMAELAPDQQIGRHAAWPHLGVGRPQGNAKDD